MRGASAALRAFDLRTANYSFFDFLPNDNPSQHVGESYLSLSRLHICVFAICHYSHDPWFMYHQPV